MKTGKVLCRLDAGPSPSAQTYGRTVSETPPHGCAENLSGTLAPCGIVLEDVPSPFDIFQVMIILPDTGELEHSATRQPRGAHVTLRAQTDLLAALSVCPDISIGGTTGATLTMREAQRAGAVPADHEQA